jgi:hypothetical protein
MKEKLIAFETAKLAKEKGFELYVKHYYLAARPNDLRFEERGLSNKYFDIHKKYAAPTQSLLQKWLREKHKIEVVVLPKLKNSNYIVSVVIKNTRYSVGKEFEVYEEALEKGLYEALKSIKD